MRDDLAPEADLLEAVVAAAVSPAEPAAMYSS